MILFFSSAAAFLLKNLKWVAIILATLSVLLIGWKFYSMTNQVATAQAEIVRLEAEINYKNLAIELYKSQAASIQEALLQRDQDLKSLEIQLEDIQNNLPEDVSDYAPPSTQEFINRLRERLP